MKASYSDLASWEQAVSRPAPTVRLPRRIRVAGPNDALLAAMVLPPNAPGVRGPRGNVSETDGRSYGGRPRGASKKRAHNMKRVKGPKSKFDSYYTGDAQ